MDKKTFALKAIAPYYKDKTKCGYEDPHCVYLTVDGRKCVFGQFLLHPETFNPSDAAQDILKSHRQEDILVPEAVNILSEDEWQELQFMHDNIARGKDPFHKDITPLFTKDELEEYIKNN